MELRHLRYFQAVAEELHFGKAAVRLNMAQPPLSLQIRQLEEEMGVLLFHRTKRNVKLTEEGKVLLEKVYQLFENLDQAIKTVKMMRDGKIGEIVVGFIATATYDILPAILKQYKKTYPGINVVLKQLTSSEQVKALQEGSIQIAILSEPQENEEINFEIIKEEPLVIAMSRNHSLADIASPIDLVSLTSEPFILTRRTANQSYYDAVINCCYQAGFSPMIEQETGEMSTIISLVAAEIGIALVPSSMQLLLQNEVVYRKVKNSKVNTVNAFAWRSDNQSPIVLGFIELVKEYIIPKFKSN